MNRVHPVAVIVAGIVFWVIQAGWYTAFRDAYIAAEGFSPEQVTAAMQNPSPLPYITSLLANMLIAYVIAIVTLRSGAPSLARGIIVGFVLWAGILMTAMATMYSFAQRPFTLLAINGGAYLVGMLVSGGICGAWTRKAAA
jgi:hypothetical protein